MADAHAKPHHDYHLVDPSPWPAIGSISAFIMAVGAICLLGWIGRLGFLANLLSRPVLIGYMN